MKLPGDNKDFVEIEVYRHITGHTDRETADWVAGEDKLIASGKGDIQPQSGKRLVNSLNTDYESNFVLYLGSDDFEFAGGVDRFKAGDVVEAEGYKYRVVFPGDWGTHYKLDLKL